MYALGRVYMYNNMCSIRTIHHTKRVIKGNTSSNQYFKNYVYVLYIIQSVSSKETLQAINILKITCYNMSYIKSRMRLILALVERRNKLLYIHILKKTEIYNSYTLYINIIHELLLYILPGLLMNF